MSEQRPQAESDRAGDSDHPQHRTPPGEASETPLSEKEGGPAEYSLYDGRGNEMTAVVGEDDEGRPREGTGPDREEALKEVKDPTKPIGSGF